MFITIWLQWDTSARQTHNELDVAFYTLAWHSKRSRCNCVGHLTILWTSGFFSSHSRIFSLIWRRHHCLWRAANVDLCLGLMAIKQGGFFSMPHLLWHWASVYNVQPEDPWHPHLLPSVWQWSCHYLFLRLRSVTVGIQTPNLPLAPLSPTGPPPRYYMPCAWKCNYIACKYSVSLI